VEPLAYITIELGVVQHIAPIVSRPYGVESISSFHEFPHVTVNVRIDQNTLFITVDESAFLRVMNIVDTEIDKIVAVRI
jgi:hypothetical protein